MSERIYRRELNHSYLVFQGAGYDISENYAYRMMERNRIGRLLACSLRQMDGETCLYYDISSRQPLARLYEGRKLGVAELERILGSIAAMQEELGSYLMDEQGLLLEADTIFADIETEELYFCFDPGLTNAADRYAGLADFLLEHVDHGQEHAVNIVYQFYKMSKAAYFVLFSFLPFLEKETAAWRKERSDGGAEGWTLPEPEAGSREDARPVDQRTGRELPDGSAEEQTELEYSLPGGETREPKGRERRFKKAKKQGLFGWLFGRKRRQEDAKEESGSAYWQDTILDSYLSQADAAGTGETVYLADLDQMSAPADGIPVLQEEEGERQFLLDRLPATVGKLKEKASIVLQDRSVSRLHACFEAGENGICLRDFNSRNGTIVNGQKLLPNEAVLLHDGDTVRFGRERFRYRLKRY